MSESNGKREEVERENERLKLHLVTMTQGNAQFGEERDREMIDLKIKNRALELDLAAGQSLLADFKQTQKELEEKKREVAVTTVAVNNLENVVSRMEQEGSVRDKEMGRLRNDAREVLLFVGCV